MTKRIVGLFTVATISAVLIAAPGASARAQTPHKQAVHFRPSREMHQWHSGRVLDDRQALEFAIWIGGHEVDARGHLVDGCHYMLLTKHLAFELANCGNSHLRMSYISDEPFTVRWWIDYGY
jgi:hypothetical protein